MLYFLDAAKEIVDGYSCENTRIFPLFQAAKLVIVIIQVAVPFALIIWGSLDWFKALIAHDEKEMRMKRKPFLARVVAAMIVLILPWIVQLISKQIAGRDDASKFWTCYGEAKPKIDFSGWELDPEDDGDGDWWGKMFEENTNTKGKNNAPKDNQGTAGTGSSSSKIKSSCSAFNSEGQTACNNGETETYKCTWESIPGGDKGQCVEGEKKEKKTCNQYGQACSNKKTDDYGAACEPKNNGSSCGYKDDAKTCEDYGQNITPAESSKCKSEDDYGNKCEYKPTNNYSGKCVTK